MHVRIVAVGIRKSEPEICRRSPKGRSSQRSLCGCLWLVPIRFGFLLASLLSLPSQPLQTRTPFFVLFLSFSCYSLIYVSLVGPKRASNPSSPRKRLSRASFGKSFRLCDNWLPHRVESNRVESRRVKSSRRQRRDPPAFNERHFSSFSIQPV